MNISLDFDETYTKDPEFWNNFIQLCQKYGHKVYCVTLRPPMEKIEVINSIGQYIGEDNIIFCSYRAKHNVCQSKKIHIDVWIDDMPWFVAMNYRPGVNP